MQFSILIPTYNRKEKLQKVLQVLGKQEGIENGEVIVGIDGSRDGTREWLEKDRNDRKDRKEDSNHQIPNTNDQGKMNVTWFFIENSGRAVIRNRLLERAKGEIILFIQDDIVVTEGWLQAHLAAHREREGAVVGHITWYPEMKITPYMKWLEHGGHLLDFDGYRDGDELDFWHFYMGNISFPRILVQDIRFDESLSTYGWEDILFGYAFVSRGKNVYYSASALAYHWDEYREENFREYMKKVGRSAVEAEKKVPGIGIVPPFWKRSVFRLLILLSPFFWPFLSQEWRWYVSMKKWFLEEI